MSFREWSPFLQVSVLVHVAAFATWAIWPAHWLWPLLVLVINHLLIAGIGLWPRSQLLGENLIRLPAEDARQGAVAITIDDGPDPDVTPKVLEILAQHGARASFFCIGEHAAAHPELIHAIVAAGHRVENHGQRHYNHLSLSGPRGWMREIGDAQETLTRLAGQAPSYYRALAGLRNPFLAPVLSTLGLRLVTWSRRGFDTACGDEDVVLQRLTHGLQSGDIVLLHDGHAARTMAGEPVILAVLPRLLDRLGQQGMRGISLPVPLSVE